MNRFLNWLALSDSIWALYASFLVPAIFVVALILAVLGVVAVLS